jgi:hypothetical protein
MLGMLQKPKRIQSFGAIVNLGNTVIIVILA